MELLLVIALLVLVIGVFIIYPIVLFFQCLFDASVTAGTKILVFLTTLFVFPIPSFCYGAFVKKSELSKFILALYVILFLLTLVFVIFFGGAAVIATYMDATNMDNFQSFIETQTQPDTGPELEYKGYNTYQTDEVNVFESSGPDEEPLPAETPAETPPQAPNEAPAQDQP